MRLAVVGSTALGGPTSRGLIEALITARGATTIVSGGADGIDKLGIAVGLERGLVGVEYKPQVRSWEDHPDGRQGFKSRNILVARDCDELLRIYWDPAEQARVTGRPATYGSGWTADRAREQGKPVYAFCLTLEQDRQALVQPSSIRDFRGRYAFLSNFHRAPLAWERLTYGSVEAAFQASKSLDPFERAPFQYLSPREAKTRGRQIQLRPDWDFVRIPVMLELLRRKFSDPALRDKLLATGTSELVEGNTWGDRFWGVCGTGENWLGKLLMLVRSEIEARPRTTVVNLRAEPYDVYIGRAGNGEEGYFGNPYRVGADLKRGQALELYRGWFARRIEDDPEFRERVLALRGKVLGCFCKPAACHGDILADWVNTQP